MINQVLSSVTLLTRDHVVGSHTDQQHWHHSRALKTPNLRSYLDLLDPACLCCGPPVIPVLIKIGGSWVWGTCSEGRMVIPAVQHRVSSRAQQFT